MKKQCKECRGFLDYDYGDDTCQSCLRQLLYMAKIQRALAKRELELNEAKENKNH